MADSLSVRLTIGTLGDTAEAALPQNNINMTIRVIIFFFIEIKFGVLILSKLGYNSIREVQDVMARGCYISFVNNCNIHRFSPVKH